MNSIAKRILALLMALALLTLAACSDEAAPSSNVPEPPSIATVSSDTPEQTLEAVEAPPEENSDVLAIKQSILGENIESEDPILEYHGELIVEDVECFAYSLYIIMEQDDGTQINRAHRRVGEFAISKSGDRYWCSADGTDWEECERQPQRGMPEYMKYVEPIGDYLTLRDSWRTEDFADKFPQFIFELLCHTQNTDYISGQSPYLSKDEDWVFYFPAEIVEELMGRYFDVSPEDLRKDSSGRTEIYNAADNTYRIAAFQGGGAYPELEVWGVEEKDDGTLAISVAFVDSFDDSNSEVGAILTVKLTEGGGFKYISNEALGDN